MFRLQIFTNVLIAYAYIMQLYPWEGVLRAHAHEFAKHMHMKIETLCTCKHTQVEETPEAGM